MSNKPAPPRRDTFAHFTQACTRWNDNDSYGHVNNVVYYSFFDTAVNQYLIERGALDIQESPVVGLVIETQCRYFSSFGFPDKATVGMKVTHLGNSSVRYEIGLFRNDDDVASALGQFVHVYVDRASNRPVAIPDHVRAVLLPLMTESVGSDLPAVRELHQ